MIKYAIDNAKEALIALENRDGDVIFSEAGDINIGFPHSDFIVANMPSISNPLVALGLTAEVLGVGYKEWLEREDVTLDTQKYRRDVYSMARMVISCEIHILAYDATELLGSTTLNWDGYIKQVLDIVRNNADMLETSSDTHIVWDLVPGLTWEMPGAVPIKDEKRVCLAIVRTTLTGRLLGEVSDGAPIEDLVPKRYGDIS